MSVPLKVQSLYKRYSENYVVRDVHFEIHPGEIFGLLGPNGAGKTTIISAITTLESPSHGSVEVFGFDVQKYPLQAKSHFGVVHQEVIHTGFFDVSETVHFQSGYYGLRKNREREDYLLNKLGLWEHRHKKVKQLSGGMKRRLMIVKSLVHSPKLLLLDEPTAGVDIQLRESLWRFVEELRNEGVAILLTTHYLEEAEQLCDRVGIINKGQIHVKGLTGEVVSQFSQRKLILTLTHELKNECELPRMVLGGYEYTFCTPSDVSPMEFIKLKKINWESVLDLRIEDGSLEEAFVRILERFQVETNFSSGVE